MANQQEPIAVIGSACRFPGGAHSPSELWNLLREPKDLSAKIPDSRFHADGFHHPKGSHHGTSNVRHSYLLSDDCRQFDAQFFGVKPVEANAMDPQQRLLLETTYESIESAGMKLEHLRGSNTAVYVGLMCGDYADLQLRDPEALPMYTATGTARSIMSNRISYFFDFHGPSETIDTACSSSLVAVHHAVTALRAGLSSVAIAGGSNICLGPEPYIGESKLSMLSPTGRSRMWDAAADGYARGDGVASVVLKTLSAALRDGNHIECIIRETGVNSDGRTPGITMPSSTAQQALIRDTYARAGLDLNKPEDRPQFFEAHGTGTPAGDPIEASAINSAFFSDKSGHERLFVGSVKTVIGHTEGTAGLAGLLKASLALQARQIPPNLHFEKLSPSVAPFYRNLKIVTGRPAPWPEVQSGTPRRASVNSFGFGGTNAHAILESYDVAQETPPARRASNFLPLPFSATSDRSLTASLILWGQYLEQNPDLDLRSLAWTLNFHRTRFPLETTFSAVSVEDLRGKMQQKLADVQSNKPNAYVSRPRQSASERKPVLGVFTGQGAQWSMMMKELVKSSSFVQQRLKALDTRLAKLPKAERPSWSLQSELLHGTDRVKEASLSQPLCTAVQIVLVDILREAEVKLDAVVGHSSGEIGAAYAAGLISAEDAICIAYYRGFWSRLAGGDSEAQGRMLAIGTDYDDAAELCALPEMQGRITIAAYNSSSSFTLSGDRKAIEMANDVMVDEGKFSRMLQVDKAYHSHHMKKCSSSYLDSLRRCQIKVRTPDKAWHPIWYSSVEEAVMSAERQDLESAYWDANMVQPVLFAQAVECAAAGHGPFAIAVEIGPHAALKGPTTQILSELLASELPHYGMLDRKKNDNEALADCMTSIQATLGVNARSLKRLDRALSAAPEPVLLKGLPSYAWNHDRSYWQESRLSRAYRHRDPVHCLLGARVQDGADQEFRWRNFMSPSEVPWLTGHMIQGQMVFPAAAYISTAVEAVKAMSKDNDIRLIELLDLTLGQAMVFEEESSKIETLVSLTGLQHLDGGVLEAMFSFSSAVGKESNTLAVNAACRLRVEYGESSDEMLPNHQLQELEMVDVSSERLYGTLENIGYGYTGPFRALTGLRRRLRNATGSVDMKLSAEERKDLTVDPAMLDATIQSIMLAESYPGDGKLWSLHVPQRIDRIAINTRLCEKSDLKAHFQTTVADREGTGLSGDLIIRDDHGEHVMIMMEGVLAVPLDAATADNDKAFFSELVWDLAQPDGSSVAFDGKASETDYQLAYVLERVAHFYLREFNSTFTSDHPARLSGLYVGLLNYADHVATSVRLGNNAYADTTWANDTEDMIRVISKRYPENIDLQIMHLIGRHMPSVIRGEANILEYLRPNQLLDRYYVDAMGISYYTQYLARLVNTIVHRYPHMNILEVGAGTGGATKQVLKHINGAYKSYTFTDISSGFFENARDFGSRMAFKVLDLEKDIVSQGFAEGSYDLIIASFVLHATSNMQETMENVRALLKPGGYLAMLEVTNLEQSRLGFIFGSLPGWWLGADDGRILSPCLPKADWDALLRKTGFSGIDTSTPDLDSLPFPASAIVTQAVDSTVSFLRSPLESSYESIHTSSALDDLVIIGGTTPLVSQIVTDLRKTMSQHAKSISHFSSLSVLGTGQLPKHATTLVLSDLDEPVFKSLSEQDLDGLRALFSSARAVLWVTHERRDNNPHHSQSLGFGRSMNVEMAHVRTQYIDINGELTLSTAGMLAASLLRFGLADGLEDPKIADHLLWSIETELSWSKGATYLPRVKPYLDANDRYNAQRRSITKQVTLQSDKSLEVVRRANDFKLQHAPLDASPPTNFVRIKVERAISHAIPTSGESSMYLVVGNLINTPYTAVALSDRNASVVIVPKTWVTLSSSKINPTCLSHVYYHALAAELLAGIEENQAVAIWEPDLGFLMAFRATAQRIGARLFVYSDQQGRYPGATVVNRHSLAREITAALDPRLVLFVDASASGRFTRRITECLPHTCQVKYMADNRVIEPSTNSSSWPATYSAKLEEYVNSAKATSVSPGASELPILTVTAATTAGQSGSRPSLCVLEWEEDAICSVSVQTVHEQTHLCPDKTYWLVGLTGSLGISLSRWMIRRGARYIVFTSRNPKIDPLVLEELSSTGANVRVLAGDATSMTSLEGLYAELKKTSPPIAGVVQGAMVLQDAMLDDVTLEQFESVLGPKVKGSENLDQLFSEATLDFFVMFSSATCVTGNIGQSNYSVANMFMTGLAAQRRKKGLAASAINIGAILGVGYVTRETSQELQENLLKSGHVWMSEEDFHTLFAEGILAGRPSSGLNPEINSGLRIINESDKQRPLWSFMPKFQHLVCPEDLVMSTAGQSGSRVSVLSQLAVAATADDALRLLTENFIDKLTGVLQLDRSSTTDIPEMTAEDMGIDSLNAVEIRSWILKVLKVDVPVLRILGGSTIHELMLFILEKLPAEVVPLLGSDRTASGSVLQPASISVPQTAVADQPARLGQAEESFEDALLLDWDPVKNIESQIEIVQSGPLADTNEDMRDSVASYDFCDSSSDETSPQMIATPATTEYTAGEGPKAVSAPDNVRKLPAFQKTQDMSFAQTNFWFLRTLIDDQTTFNVTVVLEIKGVMNEERLAQAVLAVGQHHEALRTCYIVGDSQRLTQAILEKSTLSLDVRTYANEDEQQLEIDSIKNHIYDLGRGETLRIALLKPIQQRSDGASYLVLGYPHINMDGISFQLLLDDLCKAYCQQPLEGVLQYPEHAARQQQQRAKGQWREDLQYWKRQFPALPGTLPLLPVASVRSRSVLTRYEHNKVELRLGKDLGASIRRVCQQAKVSPYHFFFATFEILLAELAGTSDFSIGVADGGRVDNDALTSIGLFLNLLPVRAQYDSDRSFIDAVKSVRSRTYGALAHSRPPIDVIISELNIPRSATHSPLFQAFVDYRQSIQETQKFGDCTLQGREYEVGRTAYDIALDISDNPEGEALVMLAVQSTLYSQEAAQSLMRSYTKLLQEFCDSPVRPISLTCLHWNEDLELAKRLGKGASSPSTWEPTLVHQVEKMARLYPNNLALNSGSGTSITYRSLMRRMVQIQSAIKQSGVVAGSRVGIFQDASADWICSMLAVLASGCVYVPLDLKVGIQRLAVVVEDCKPALVIFDETTSSLLGQLKASAAQTINVNALEAADANQTQNIALAENPATILYTSGSTGTPKGVVLTHAGLRNNIEGCSSRFGIKPTDYGLFQISLSFDFSVWQIFMCLANGAALYMAPKTARGDAKSLTEIIVNEGITFTGATPSEYVSWFKHGNTKALKESAWTCAVSSGEQMTNVMKGHFAALGKLDLKLFNGYGPTEGSIAAASIPVIYEDPEEAARSFTPGGTTLPNYAIYILDGKNKLLPAGFQGQIAIGGAGVGLGYLNMQDLSDERFPANPFAPSEYLEQKWSSMHLTGDRGMLRSDGALLVQGRIAEDTQVKLRGLRIDLRDIEVAIVRSSEDLIEDAVVTVRQAGEDNSDFLVAHVVLQQGLDPTRQTTLLKNLPNSLPLPQYMVPAVFVVIDRLPLNAHLKLDRRAVAKLILPETTQERVQTLSAELGSVEAKLGGIWSAIIPASIRGQVEIHKTTDFFEIGGNSILLLKLQDEIASVFNVDLPLVQLFESSSLESMAARIVPISSSLAVTEAALEQTTLPVAKPKAVTTDSLKSPIAAVSVPRRPAPSYKPMQAVDWEEEIRVPSDIERPERSPRKPNTGCIVLTGATGFLGTSILRRLTQDRRVNKIHCIAVRQPERFQAEHTSDKIIVHRGDLATPSFGLSEAAAREIFADADAVIHNGADVSFLKPYAALRATNVESTQEIIRLANVAGVPIHYVSTAGVAQVVGRGVLGEESLSESRPLAKGNNIGTGYAATKWVSEILLENSAATLGLHVTIHRPSNIVGDQDHSTDLVDNLLHFSRKISAVPVSDVWNSTGELDFVSLDAVATGISNAALAENPVVRRPLLRHLHHSGEVRVPLNSVKQYLERQTGRILRTVPLAVWIAEAEMQGLDTLLAEVLVDAEKRGVRMEFSRLIKGRSKPEPQIVKSGWLGSLAKMASSVGKTVSMV